MTSNEKRSKSLRKNWSKLSSEERAARMKPLTIGRQKALTKAERSAIASKASIARWAKHNKKKSKAKKK